MTILNTTLEGSLALDMALGDPRAYCGKAGRTNTCKQSMIYHIITPFPHYSFQEAFTHLETVLKLNLLLLHCARNVNMPLASMWIQAVCCLKLVGAGDPKEPALKRLRPNEDTPEEKNESDIWQKGSLASSVP